MNSNDEMTERGQKGRKTLLLILGLFVLPILVVLAMYQFSLRPGGASHGELLSPPRPLHFAPMTTWQTKPFTDAGLHEKWSLLYIAPADCTEPCMAQIHMMRQIHAALGKEMGRVQRVMLVAENAKAAQIDAVQRDYPDLIILAKPETIMSQLGSSTQADGSMFLIDPLGNAMMHYAPTANPNGIRKDLSHLLRYSWTG